MRDKLTPRVGKMLAGKFQVDVLWNVASLAVMGVCGILLNVLVGVFYDVATLGVFNQVFAAYILFSQFAVAGLHYAVLKFVAQHAVDPRTCATVILGSLIPTTALGGAVTMIFWLSRDLIGSLVESDAVRDGVVWAAPGLFFFAMNKVLLGALNGLRHMRVYAVLQAMRWVLMIAAFGVAGALNAPGYTLPVVFSVAETTLFLISAALVAPHLSRPRPGLGQWIRTLVAFGIRSFVAGVLVELNTRVDVLMLGYFSGDRLVGIYSLAAILAEGFFQLLVVLRNNYNPVLVKLLHDGALDELYRVVRKGRLVAYGLMLPVALLAVALYPLGVGWIKNAADFMEGWPLFAILMTGIVLSAGYMPFNQILLAAGRPGMHTLLVLAVVAFNVIGNAVLIPLAGAPGAAMATGLSFVFYAAALIVLTRALTGARL